MAGGGLRRSHSGRTPGGAEASGRSDVASVLRPLVETVLGGPSPVRFDCWDGTGFGPTDGPGTVTVRSADAICRVLWAPGELGIARAFVAGDIDLDGDVFAVLRLLHRANPGGPRQLQARSVLAALDAARRLGAIRLPLPPPVEESRLTGRRHSVSNDARAISHHYDVGNDFYRMVLGPSMTYSCARFVDWATGLDDAQSAKHDMVCRKLGLDARPGARVLDVGCGWGSMAMHAASHYGANVVGITLSPAQAGDASRRVREAGLDGQVEIRLQDYRHLTDDRFDAISSIGMFEHVGTARMDEYFHTLHRLLVPTGRLLNHAISSPGGSRLGRRGFIGRYVFPDGELLDVGSVVLAMQRAGFEVRDVESLREHYSRTLHAWIDNLRSHWDGAVAAVGMARARVWLLYMAASANGFDDGGLAVHQVVGVVPDAGGRSAMPPTRTSWS